MDDDDEMGDAAASENEAEGDNMSTASSRRNNNSDDDDDDKSLVGFGEGAGSTISGPTSSSHHVDGGGERSRMIMSRTPSYSSNVA